MIRKVSLTLIVLVLAMLIAWTVGYSQAWAVQEERRLECGAGWYATLELVSTLMEDY